MIQHGIARVGRGWQRLKSGLIIPPLPPPPSVASKLAFLSQPQSAQINTTLPVIHVVTQDVNGVTAPYSGTVTVVLSPNPGALAGTVQVTVVDSIATFSTLSVTQAADGYSLTATASGLASAVSALFNITASPPPPTVAFDWFVSPTGTSSNSGTIDSPWSLAHALAGANGFIAPGDVIALRRGSYIVTAQAGFVVSLVGSAAAPIVFRAFTGERATLQGGGTLGQTVLHVNGVRCYFQDVEIIGNNRIFSSGANLKGTENKLINCHIHNAMEVGVSAFQDLVGGEIYGCIIHNVPQLEAGAGGYSMYINHNSGVVKKILDNVVFNLGGYGTHGYTPTAGDMQNLEMVGNIVFNQGVTVDGFPGELSAAFLFSAPNPQNIVYTDNYCYHPNDALTWALQISALEGSTLSGITLRRNYLHGGSRLSQATSLIGTDNTFYGPRLVIAQALNTSGNTAGWTWANNVHYSVSGASPNTFPWRHPWAIGHTTLAAWRAASGIGTTDTNPGAAPTGTQVFVRPNAYEPARANIIIFNWAESANVSVDLSSVLSIGQNYTIKNVQDYYGGAVVSGTYDGAPVSIPMAGFTGPRFQVFLARLSSNWES